jgi:hypothetical protein
MTNRMCLADYPLPWVAAPNTHPHPVAALHSNWRPSQNAMQYPLLRGIQLHRRGYPQTPVEACPWIRRLCWDSHPKYIFGQPVSPVDSSGKWSGINIHRRGADPRGLHQGCGACPLQACSCLLLHSVNTLLSKWPGVRCSDFLIQHTSWYILSAVSTELA